MDTPTDMDGTVFTPTIDSKSVKRRVTPVAFMIDLAAGSPVGEYVIEEQLGEGGMGTVYLAVHPVLGKRVAIKVLKPELCTIQASVDRFVQEAQAITKIGHPNIVDVFTLGELPDGRAYFVMELLKGEDLRLRLKRGSLPILDACDILDGIARALQAAHAKSIVHRDLKPDNVFLHNPGDDGPPQVKLLDFGIAKLIRPTDQAQTATGNILGTPKYCSPEQARGLAVDHRSDIYSLGVMAYEMLAGNPPFQAETAVDLVLMHVNTPAPPMTVKIPRSLEQTVMRMLEKDPKRRPSLEEARTVFVDPSRRITPIPGRVGVSGTLPRVPGPKRAKVAALGVLAVVVIGGLLWQVARHKGPDPAPAVVVAPPVSVPTTIATPVAAPKARGTIAIDVSGVKDAEILVDGASVGRGTMLKVPADAGAHTIEVRPPKGAAITRDVTVESDRESSVAIAIEVPKTAPPIVKKPPPIIKTPIVKTAPPKPLDDPDALMRPKR